MNTQERINKLKQLPTESNYATVKIIVVQGFENLHNGDLKVLIGTDEYAIIDWDYLKEFDENAVMFMNHVNYYHSSINDMLERYITETENIKILKEEE